MQQSGTANQSVTMSTLALGAATDFSVTSTGMLTVSSGITGAYSVTKSGSGAGALVFSGNNTYSGGTTVSGGTLSVTSTTGLGTGAVTVGSGATLELASGASGATFNSIILSGGTLRFGSGTFNITSLQITGASTIDFGSGSAVTLNTGTLELGSTLNVSNWVNGVDNFLATNFTGATLGVRGASPVNQITFSLYSSNSTGWISEGGYNRITPVPEPGITGALLGAGALLLWSIRRRRAA
jgi:autotransporter-associated beta strand protein